MKVRPMKVTYHLDDDTISLFEPHSTNSGHIQVNFKYRVFNFCYFRVECSIDKKFLEMIGVLEKTLLPSKILKLAETLRCLVVTIEL